MVQYPPGYDEWNYSDDLDSTHVRIFSACFALVPLVLFVVGAGKLFVLRRIHGAPASVAAEVTAPGKTPSALRKSRRQTSKQLVEISSSAAALGTNSTAVAQQPHAQVTPVLVAVAASKYAAPDPSPSPALAPVSSRPSATFTVPSWLRHKSALVASISLFCGLAGIVWCLNLLIRGKQANMNRDLATVLLGVGWFMLLGVGQIHTQYQWIKLGVGMMRKNGGGGGSRQKTVDRWNVLLHVALCVNALMFLIIGAVLLGIWALPLHTRKWVTALAVAVWILTLSGPAASYVVVANILRTLEKHAQAVADTDNRRGMTSMRGVAGTVIAGGTATPTRVKMRRCNPSMDMNITDAVAIHVQSAVEAFGAESGDASTDAAAAAPVPRSRAASRAASRRTTGTMVQLSIMSNLASEPAPAQTIVSPSSGGRKTQDHASTVFAMEISSSLDVPVVLPGDAAASDPSPMPTTAPRREGSDSSASPSPSPSPQPPSSISSVIASALPPRDTSRRRTEDFRSLLGGGGGGDSGVLLRVHRPPIPLAPRNPASNGGTATSPLTSPSLASRTLTGTTTTTTGAPEDSSLIAIRRTSPSAGPLQQSRRPSWDASPGGGSLESGSAAGGSVRVHVRGGSMAPSAPGSRRASFDFTAAQHAAALLTAAANSNTAVASLSVPVRACSQPNSRRGSFSVARPPPGAGGGSGGNEGSDTAPDGIVTAPSMQSKLASVLGLPGAGGVQVIESPLNQMALWQSKLSALKKSLVPIVLTAGVGVAVFFVPWMGAHMTYVFPMCIIATNLALLVAAKQLPTD